MSDRRLLRWATTSARVVVGTGIAVASVVAVTLGVAAVWPSHTTERVAVTATPAPSAVTVACDGPLLALGRVVEQAGEYAIAAEQDVVAQPSDSGAGQLAGPAGSAPRTVTALPESGATPVVAAAGSASVSASDLTGFAASACRPPLMESWIVGGSSALGANDLLLLANPGEVAATVQITAYGASGARTPPGGVNRVVAPGEQEVIPLAGLAAGEASPALRITASGAPVAASLQSSLIRTLLPGGIDQVAPIAAAGERQVIPGVSVTLAPTGGSSPATILRILAPSDDTSAVVTVLAADGTIAEEATSVPLTAGIPSELELGELAVGRYTLQITADAPIVAGAWSTTGFGEGSDFAWYAPAPEISLPTLFAVASGEGPVLTIANSGPEDVDVALSQGPGAPQTVSVPAGEVAEAPVTAGSLYTLDPSGPVSASVSYAAAGAVAGYPVWGADAAAGPIVVFP